MPCSGFGSECRNIFRALFEVSAMQYVAVIHKDAGSDYGVHFPDFPGCITAGTNLADARAMAKEALAFHIKGLRADGAVIPDGRLVFVVAAWDADVHVWVAESTDVPGFITEAPSLDALYAKLPGLMADLRDD
jgi:predicted RNase H-like HicB family nuclease